MDSWLAGLKGTLNPWDAHRVAVWPGLLARPFFLELSPWGAGGAAPRVATLLRRYDTWIVGLRA